MKWETVIVVKDDNDTKGANPKGDDSCFRPISTSVCCDGAMKPINH